MKITICFTFLGLSLALLSTDQTKAGSLYFEPRSNYTLDGGRILGGEEVAPHSRPYHVAILINGRSLCSGSLISPNYVLTAAHCTINATYVDLIFGAHNINVQEPSEIHVTSTVIINHPDYGNPSTYSNDIALIKIPTPIVTNNYIKLVRLPPADAGSYEGTVAALSGWGTTSDSNSSLSTVLREVYLVIWDLYTCYINTIPDVYDDESNICTSGTGKVGACNGDSGGPLVFYNTQRLLWKSENIYVDPISNYTAPQPIDRRIFGGHEAEPHSRPYQVALLINGRSLCGGSLISVNFVLTAAHCTTNASYVQMVFGAHNILAEEPTQVRVTSANIINHPDFNSRSLNNDIALIKTPRPVVTNNYIQTIELVPSTVGTYVGYTVILTGWGTTSNSSSIPSGLHEVQLVVMDNRVCGKVYGTDFVKPTHLCTYGSGTVGGCNGDSGGPLIDGYYFKYQIGITSFISSNGCESGDPTGYTRISTFRPWIDANSDL